MEIVLQHLINALKVGSVYAVIALGYTMVYGIIKLINFAHGEMMMFGAYFAFVLSSSTPLPFWAVLLISMALTAGLGMLIEKIAYTPLRKAPRLSVLITAIGMSLLLQNIAQLIWGAEPKRMPKVELFEAIRIGGVKIDAITIITIGLSVIFMVGLQLFVKYTKPGKAMRAVSEDKDAAALMGINVNTTITLTFAIGTALGALGGVLYGIAYQKVEFVMGVMPGLKAFVAAVLGGIGLIPGAMLGGFIIGLVENITKAYISTAWADGIVFLILIIVLLVKPSGIMGKNLKEKV
ncbi:MAG: branched-chain amino acid ABC transporter permease [Eubacteriales bacterium]